MPQAAISAVGMAITMVAIAVAGITAADMVAGTVAGAAIGITDNGSRWALARLSWVQPQRTPTTTAIGVTAAVTATKE